MPLDSSDPFALDALLSVEMSCFESTVPEPVEGMAIIGCLLLLSVDPILFSKSAPDHPSEPPTAQQGGTPNAIPVLPKATAKIAAARIKTMDRFIDCCRSGKIEFIPFSKLNLSPSCLIFKQIF
jgi:hypothetical protein